MTDGRDTLHSLWIQIQNNRVDAIDGRCFVPPASLASIFTPAAVSAAVAELSCAAEDRIGLAYDIRNGGVATFAVLVWMRRADVVVDFRRHRCLDRLPLDATTAKRVAGECAPTFLRLQWEFRPYHFRRGHDVEITRSEILPFVRELDSPTSGGSAPSPGSKCTRPCRTLFHMP